MTIYEIPSSIEEIFTDLESSDGHCQYRIIDYSDGMDMDNIQSMGYLLDQVEIDDEFIVEDEGTKVVLSHPGFKRRVVIHSGGLGDFFSHGFDVMWEEG